MRHQGPTEQAEEGAQGGYIKTEARSSARADKEHSLPSREEDVRPELLVRTRSYIPRIEPTFRPVVVKNNDGEIYIRPLKTRTATELFRGARALTRCFQERVVSDSIDIKTRVAGRALRGSRLVPVEDWRRESVVETTD